MCRVVGFIGASGGIGCSSLVFEIAQFASRKGKKVCVFDACFNKNSVSNKFKLKTKIDFKEYLIGDFGEEYVLNKEDENLWFVKTDAVSFDYFRHFELIKKFVFWISEHFDYLIFDLDKNEKINFKMFEILSEIFIVSGDEKESVLKSRRLLNRLCFYNNITNKKIIVNKAHIVLQVKGFCLMQNEIEELLKTEVLCVIPNFYKYNYFNYKNITKEQRKIINNFCNSFITNKRCKNRLCEKFVGVIGFFRRKLYEKFE